MSTQTLPDPAAALAVVRDYHQRTKHRFAAYAHGPGTLDWDAQPAPFRHFDGAEQIALPRLAALAPGSALHAALQRPFAALDEPQPPLPVDLASIGALLQLSLGLTAWKSYGPDRWALRANPSSGNLHPTEAYLLLGGVKGLADGLYHYRSENHALELRASHATTGGSPRLAVLLTSVMWREAWKYGERAFRYCQLDLGHVLAAVSYAATLLGWRAQLLRLDSPEVADCLGLDRETDFAGVEAEEPEVIVALETDASPPCGWTGWAGTPGLLDPRPLYQWPVIDDVAAATRGALPSAAARPPQPAPLPSTSIRPATEVILHRRSAQAFDGRSVLPHAVFRRLLACLLPGGAPVWNVWPHAPRVHPLLLVHRVEGVPPGLYALPRSDAAAAALREAPRAEFAWEAADPDLPLYRLLQATATRTARTLSCHQDIASHGAVTFMLLAEFAAPIAENPAAYRHLHWEAGMLGHVVTLEAEAAGWRGTGIGCFFDDADHDVLGLTDNRFQVLYHFAVGMPVDDPRLLTLPAYDE